jgi:hypothetical protein
MEKLENIVYYYCHKPGWLSRCSHSAGDWIGYRGFEVRFLAEAEISLLLKTSCSAGTASPFSGEGAELDAPLHECLPTLRMPDAIPLFAHTPTWIDA